jgi:hypothetical protein
VPTERADPFEILGLAPGATADEVRAARRRLAKRAHPDAGGNHRAMQQVNDAAAAALAATPPPGPEPAPEPAPEPDAADPGPDPAEHPNEAAFTVDALPVVACHFLLAAVATLGEVLDADEPYRIEAYLNEPAPCFATLDLVPEAGGSIVTVTVDGPTPTADDVITALARV